MDFQTFLKNYTDTPKDYWTTHKIMLDPSGNIEIEEGSNTEDEIISLFKEKMAFLEESFNEDFSLLDHAISVSSHFKNDLGIEVTNIIGKYKPFTIEASNGKLELSLIEYQILRKTPVFRAAFEGGYSEAFTGTMRFPEFLIEDIQAYLEFIAKGSVYDVEGDWKKLSSICAFASYLNDQNAFEKCIKFICVKLKTLGDFEPVREAYIHFLNDPLFSSNRELQRTLATMIKWYLIESHETAEPFFKRLSKDLGKVGCKNVEVLDLSELNLTPQLFVKLRRLFPSVQVLNISEETLKRSDIPKEWIANLEITSVEDKITPPLIRNYFYIKDGFASYDHFDTKDVFSILQIAIYLEDEDFVNQSFDFLKKQESIPLETVKSLYINSCKMLNFLRKEEMQILWMNALNKYFKEKPSGEILSFFTELANELGAITAEKVTYLNLSYCNISHEDLTALSNLFPNIRGLLIGWFPGTTLTIPEKWRNSLEFLSITRSNLSEIIGIDGSLSLKYLNIKQTKLRRAPTGCANLVEFEAFDTPHLRDITGLNDLKHLEMINLERSASTNVPTGLEQLRDFIGDKDNPPNNVEELSHLKKDKDKEWWIDPAYKYRNWVYLSG